LQPAALGHFKYSENSTRLPTASRRYGRLKTCATTDAITFTYRESESGATKLATVSAPEFLRRFLQHVLPRGFQRVRYFGWLAPRRPQSRPRV